VCGYPDEGLIYSSVIVVPRLADEFDCDAVRKANIA